jgi:hypothetical protein
LAFSGLIAPAISPKGDLAACNRGLEEVDALDKRHGKRGLPGRRVLDRECQ